MAFNQLNAKSYNLGSSGTLVEVRIPSPSCSKLASATKSAIPIIILDQSGSMGRWATLCPPIISEALAQAGFPLDQRVEFITFASRCAYSTTTVLELRDKGAESSGGTHMLGAVEKLRTLLTKSDPDEDIQLIVVSDGHVSDIPRVLSAADTLRAECEAGRRSIDASLIRLITSTYGAPDTRAISCLGQLSAARVDVLDLDGVSRWGDKGGMVREIAQTLSGCNKYWVKFNQPVSASLTGNGDRVLSMTFNRGSNYVMIPQDVDESNLQVEFEGQTFAVKKYSGTFGEEHIKGFLRLLENKTRMLAVVGTSRSQKSLKEISDWLEGVENVFSSMEVGSSDEKKDVDHYTLASRKKIVLAKVLKSQKGLVNSLKHLANVDAVADLNSQQKADFLRGVSNNKSGRGLARRAAKSTVDMNPDELAANGVRNLASSSIPMHEEETAIKSFYSFASAPECLELAADLTQLVDEGASASDILQLIGLPGVSFVARRANYLDPWTFRVQHVFTGDSMMLSQSDLWHSMNVAGGSGALCPPGFDTAITGVDPLRFPNPNTYDTYLRVATGINKLHASVSMRGLLAPVPGDEHAIKTAVALNLIHVCANGGGTGSVLEKLGMELEDIATLSINNTIQKHMLTLEPGAYFTGDLGIGNVMRLYSALLGWKGIATKVQSRQRQRILRDMYSLAAYHQLKHVEDRGEAINRLLGINVMENGTHLTPINEPNPHNPVHCSEFRANNEVTQSFNVLSPNEGALVMGTRELVDAGKSLSNLGECVDTKAAYGVGDEFAWRVAVMVQALKCKKASNRVDTTEGARKMLIKDLTTPEQCRSFLSAAAHDVYKADYENRLSQKTEEEAKMQMLKLVEDLIGAESMQNFINLMQQIPNRSAEAFGLVLETLVKLSSPPLRFRKIWVCLLGRDIKGRPVWNDGNCFVGDLKKYHDAFCEAGESERWEKLLDMRAKFPIHKYRDGSPNRHGHSNDFPSFYAWGFQSLGEFKEGVDSATFKEYCAAHAKRGCCGLSV